MLSLKTLLVFICLAAAGGGFYEASASSRYKVDDFLNPSARVKAMGASGAAMGECSSALAVNPAVTAYEPHGRVSLFYGNISGNTHLGYIEYNYRQGSLFHFGFVDGELEMDFLYLSFFLKS